MTAVQLSIAEILFVKYRSMTPNLMDIVRDYYPQLSKAEALRKASNQAFPFPVFRLDKSKRAPYLVHINDLAKAIEDEYEKSASDHTKLHQ
ncbi:MULTISPECIES: pyocin activator PrtN family protein [unclassified Acinetobacter]|uniref:pyocin activator PrtN family protein n=1 Tax=unclassified Acinetobacter TaxID=196816 RepID=UPI0024482E7D|nr:MULTISPECIES: pyocin activator PrtN family protein [unclassified Acinetobacter]MDH0031372.1 pyocin activator PrtN family protein [Acinetobacter sp. GD04021]MDH0887143.1 pyocin activator PrtN family protein [Acinetobacter sp. GD03873]MDH1083568.1 pyocin activator PrtN family protein [Acinetobacter sp. GD03983]MDH2190459.1 pyocin activator PrtN family protein [Acinetobacter sp. GD03645]MDH2204095.1 pyocin activator PrtN family protein [Acinetobacter sp. GD03647]